MLSVREWREGKREGRERGRGEREREREREREKERERERARERERERKSEREREGEGEREREITEQFDCMRHATHKYIKQTDILLDTESLFKTMISFI